MFTRIVNYLRALFGIKLDQLEDPDVLLRQAQDEMKQAHARNQQQAISALTQRNNLQAEVDKTQKLANNLQAKAEIAVKNGDRDLAMQILREKQMTEQNLATLQTSLDNAKAMTDQIKTAMSREEERIRTKTAEAMALKTQWKQAQIENSIQKAMSNWQDSNTDQAFERAAAKISNAQSESRARAELASGSLNGRIAALEDSQADAAASQELAAMEARFGVNQPATTTTGTTPQVPVANSQVERELAEIEARVGQGGNPGTTGS